MATTARYKAISVTVPVEMERALSDLCRKEIRKKSEVVQEALRLYFGVRSGKRESGPLAMPRPEEERQNADLSSFAPEWSSTHDSAYDILGRK